jgi:hypothetical protein
VRHIVDRNSVIPSLNPASRTPRHPLGTVAAAYRRGGRDPARSAAAEPLPCDRRGAGGIDHVPVTRRRSSQRAASTRPGI